MFEILLMTRRWGNDAAMALIEFNQGKSITYNSDRSCVCARLAAHHYHEYLKLKNDQIQQ